MASISRDTNGQKRIQFMLGKDQRKSIRLGAVSMKYAEAVKVKVEALVAAAILGAPAEPEVARWVASRPDELHRKLARAGLVEPRERTAATLGALLDAYFGCLDVKPSTRTTYLQTRQSLENYFGDSRRLMAISSQDAEAWRKSMVDAKLAPATISKRIKQARSIFARAVRWRMIPENPMADLVAGKQTNSSRQRFIDRPTMTRVIDAAPDAEWRLIICLARYGGLRVPSEALALRWTDVDWERSRLRIRSSKTERYEGRSERLIPIFPELRQPLMDVFEQAPEGAQCVINRYREGSNLNPQLRRIIKHAHLEPWPRTWHNLRASRATELAAEHPGHVAAAWLGHTEAIADDHYRMVREEDYERAIKGGADGAESGAVGSLTAQNPAQQAVATARHESPQPSTTSGLVPPTASNGHTPHKTQVTPAGFEPALPP